MSDPGTSGCRSEKEIFFEALDKDTPQERAAFLDEACGTNAAQRAKVEALLTHHFQHDDFMKEPAVEPTASAMLPVASTQTPSLTIGRYKLLEIIGEGGFGEVWMAEQRDPVKRRVAVKILKLGMDSKQVVARFEAERQALAMMDHANIAKIFDAGTTDPLEGSAGPGHDSRIHAGRPYFVMELVRGLKITDYCDRNQLPTRERLDLFVKVCHAIQHAHQKGVIHRDIKPSNVLVTLHDGPATAGCPKVIDFGIAKATQQELTDKTVFTQFQQFMGTPAYISPEQAEMSGLDIDTRADIYSLGVLLYELLVGQTPFDAKEMMKGGLDALRHIIRDKEPLRPSTKLNTLNNDDRKTAAQCRQTELPKLVSQLRGDLDWIVMKCLEKDRNRRYETANGLAADVRRYLGNEPIVARPPSTVYRMSKLVRRNPVVTGLGLLLFLALTAAVLLGSWMSLGLARAKRETDQANRRLSQTVRLLESEKMEELAAQGRRSQPIVWLASRLRKDPTDAAAAARLLSMLEQHSFALPLCPPLQHDGKVTSAWFAPNGTEIMTASEDGTVRFWDARDGRLLRVMTNDASVASADYVAGGKRLLVRTHDSIVRVYDTADGASLFEVPGLRNPTTALYEGGGGRWVFLEDQTNGLTRWDLQTGARLEPAMSFPSRIRGMDLSEAGACLAVHCADNTVHILDQSSGQPLTPPRRFTDLIQFIRFTPDGRRLFVSQNGGRRIKIWDYRSGTDDSEFVPPPPIHIEALLFTPDGRSLLTYTWASPIRIWDAETFQLVGGPIDVGVHPVLFLSRDGRRAACASQTGTFRVIDIRSGQALVEAMEHQGRVWGVMFNSNDTRIVSASVDGTARLLDIQMRKPASPRFPLATGGKSAAFNRAGNRIIVSVERNAVQVCDAATVQPIGPRLSHPEVGEATEIQHASFSMDDSRILTVGSGGLVRVWNASTLKPLVDLAVGDAVVIARLSPDARYVVVGDRRGLATVWSAETGRRLAALSHNGNEVIGLNFHPRGGAFVTAAVDGIARCWTLPSGQAAATAPLKHRGVIWSVAYSPDGERLVTASADGTAQVWDARTGQALLKPFRHTRDVYLAVFSPDGRRVLTTSDDGTARVWDARTGEAVSPSLRHSARIWMGAFSPDGRLVATGSDDRTVRLWDPESGFCMSEPLRHPDALVRLAFSPDGRRLLSFGGEARLWDVVLPPTPVPTWFCELVEALAGFQLAEDGQLVLVGPEALITLRKRLATGHQQEYYSRWAKWFLVDRMQDPASAFRTD